MLLGAGDWKSSTDDPPDPVGAAGVEPGTVA